MSQLKCTALTDRGFLRLSGEDKHKFLNGLMTGCIDKISEDQGIYTTLLTPQGKFLYDIFIVQEDQNTWLLESDKARLELLLKKLKQFKLRSKIEIDLANDLSVYALWGAVPTKNKGQVEKTSEGILFTDPRLKIMGQRFISATPPQGFEAAPPEAYEIYRIKLGIPNSMTDLLPERSILLESGLDELGAIDWQKGCFIGQELTARTRYRGLVRKRLLPFLVDGDLSKDMLIHHGTAEVGEIRSHCQFEGQHWAIGMIRLDHLAGGTDLMCGKAILRPSIPEWVKLPEAEEVLRV